MPTIRPIKPSNSLWSVQQTKNSVNSSLFTRCHVSVNSYTTKNSCSMSDDNDTSGIVKKNTGIDWSGEKMSSGPAEVCKRLQKKYSVITHKFFSPIYSMKTTIIKAPRLVIPLDGEKPRKSIPKSKRLNTVPTWRRPRKLVRDWSLPIFRTSLVGYVAGKKNW